VNEYTAIINKLNAAIKNEQFQRVAATTVLAPYKKRIFSEGKDAQGQKIGTYGTKPISISKKNQARQTGKTYFAGGYAEYKNAIGKNPGFVNLRNTDQMMMDLGLIKNGANFAFGFQNDLNGDKSKWMDSKYDKDIFNVSQAEIDLFANTFKAQVFK
jgi:hypothetical protein